MNIKVLNLNLNVVHNSVISLECSTFRYLNVPIQDLGMRIRMWSACSKGIEIEIRKYRTVIDQVIMTVWSHIS